MCEFHDSDGNGLGDIWWTDKLIYFSIIDIGAIDVVRSTGNLSSVGT